MLTMASLLSLPAELWLPISDLLGRRDLLRLSSTCKGLRNKLVQHVFKTISVSSKPELAESALAAVAAYGAYTTHIKFAGTALCDDKRITPALPVAAQKLLSGHGMPNLRTATISFPFDFDEGEPWTNHPESAFTVSIYVFEQSEKLSEVEQAEREFQWRALMNETWLALSKNTSITELILDRFIPKCVTAFYQPEFSRFLGQLEIVNIHVVGGDNGAGWTIQTVDGYRDFLGSLGSLFFRNMNQIKDLSLLASFDGPIGQVRGLSFCTSLPLRPGDMPQLQRLKLRNCFIGHELLDFLVSRIATLSHIDLANCVANSEPDGTEYGDMDWSAFFSSLLKLRPPRLVSFVAGDDFYRTIDEVGGVKDVDEDSVADEAHEGVQRGDHENGEDSDNDDDNADDEEGVDADEEGVDADDEGDQEKEDEEEYEEQDDDNDEDDNDEARAAEPHDSVEQSLVDTDNAESQADNTNGQIEVSLDVDSDSDAELGKFALANPDIRLFRYGLITDKYGDLDFSGGHTLEAMKAGRDNKTYQDLKTYIDGR